MKLSEFAKKNNVCYRTAWNWFKEGKIPNAHKIHSGSILVDDVPIVKPSKETNIVVYARVSSSENKSNLESQANRIVSFANAKGYKISNVVKEIGSGLNDERQKLEKLLLDDSIDIIIVEHKDRLARFGINYIQKLLNSKNRKIEIINNIESEKDDLMQDFVSVITSFCARLYGLRRSKRKTQKIIEEIAKAT